MPLPATTGKHFGPLRNKYSSSTVLLHYFCCTYAVLPDFLPIMDLPCGCLPYFAGCRAVSADCLHGAAHLQYPCCAGPVPLPYFIVFSRGSRSIRHDMQGRHIARGAADHLPPRSRRFFLRVSKFTARVRAGVYLNKNGTAIPKGGNIATTAVAQVQKLGW